METAKWLAHGDDQVVDSLHDILEGPRSMAPVAMEPTKPPPQRRGLGAILPAGVFLGVIVAVGLRMVVPAAEAAAASAITGRLSAPALELSLPAASDDADESGSVAQLEEKADEKTSKKRAVAKRRRAHRRTPAARPAPEPSDDDIYASLE